MYDCPYCDRGNFSTKNYLNQHIQKKASCRQKQARKRKGQLVSLNEFDVSNYISGAKDPPKKKRRQRESQRQNPEQDDDRTEHSLSYAEAEASYPDEDPDEGVYMPGVHDLEDDDPDEEVDDPNSAPNTEIRQAFQEYCFNSMESNIPLTKEEKFQIKMLHGLWKDGAPLHAFDKQYELALKYAGKIEEHERIHHFSGGRGSRKALLQWLYKRYNLQDMKVYTKTVTLPGSKSSVPIPLLDNSAVFTSLLSDPRVNAEDFMFFDNDPFAPPPPDLDYIGDLNTGLAYTETWKRLIGVPGTRKVLLPTVFYIDGANTGHIKNLPITAVKITLGIWNRKARDKEYLWRTIGYIPEISKHNSRGKKMFVDSGHLDSLCLRPDLLEGEGDASCEASMASDEDDNSEEEADEPKETGDKAQDFHTILRIILKQYVELQNTGFLWDLQVGETMYKDVHFIPFVPFIKCDTDEADLLCGHYRSRGMKVKSLCRYCTCPTDELDVPKTAARHRLKTQPRIQRMVDRGDLEALKAISQQYIHNAWYDVRFGLHDDMGVHGACPMEMLHQLLLGNFLAVRDCFFEQLGPKSAAADEINSLAKSMGQVFKRQSDRKMPRTKFKNGIQDGIKNATEYTGVLLVIDACIMSSKGRDILQEGRVSSSFFGTDEQIKDWIMLIETLLEWEAWLRSPTYKRNHVERAKKKHLTIMYLMIKIANRSSGNGFKTAKTHGIAHMPYDMLKFGVAEEYDTGSNESAHKPTKKAAKRTQKNEDTFVEQTANRLREGLAIDMAMLEIAGRVLWEYHEGGFMGETTNSGAQALESGSVATVLEGKGTKKEDKPSGAVVKVYYDEEKRRNDWAFAAKKKPKGRATVEQCAIDFLCDLQEDLEDHLNGDDLLITTEHKRNDTIFRAHPNFRGAPWRDWVLVDWGRDGVLPAHIWFFVDLSFLPETSVGNFHGVPLKKGLYAMVESAEPPDDDDEVSWSDIFVPIYKEVEQNDKGRFKRKFYLADVAAFKDVCTVIPDIGGAPHAYFQMRPMSSWGGMFEKWLEAPYSMDDEMEN